jgi:hypothetical protein
MKYKPNEFKSYNLIIRCNLIVKIFFFNICGAIYLKISDIRFELKNQKKKFLNHML